MADAETKLGQEAAGLVADAPQDTQKAEEMRVAPSGAPQPKINETENAAATSGGHYQPAGEKVKGYV